MWNLRVLSTLLILASVYGLIEKIDLMEATEQMDGIVDSVSDENQDIGSKTSSSDQSSILIAVYSGLIAGASWGFLGGFLGGIWLGDIYGYGGIWLGDIPAIHLSPKQMLSLYMTFVGSHGTIVGFTSEPFWGLLHDAPKQVALAGAVLVSAGLIVLGPLPLRKTFTTIIIGLVLHGAGQAASVAGGFAYAKISSSLTGNFILGSFFGWLLGIVVGGTLYLSDSITFDRAIVFIVFMKVVNIARIFFVR